MAKTWDEEEVEFLYENVGILKVDTIAKKLNKTVNSVLLKMNRLNISNTKLQTGLITIGELSHILGVDRKTVENWCFNHDLAYVKKRTRQTRYFYLIESKKFWEWAYIHQERIDFSKIERNTIPPEPEWVDIFRVQKKEIKGNYYRPWTTLEENLVLQLRQQRKTYKEIAQVLNRTALSIERKYKRLNSKNIS